VCIGARITQQRREFPDVRSADVTVGAPVESDTIEQYIEE
jgi:hypothetical protein